MFNHIVNFLFPASCVLCKRYLPTDNKSSSICDFCWSQIEFIKGLLCQKCGEPLPAGGAHCAQCLKKGVNYHFEFIRAVCEYKGIIKQCIHLFKYSNKDYLARTLGGLLIDYIKNTTEFSEINTIVPVPLHWSRRFQRGYNQSELLSKEIAKALDKDLVVGNLYRRKVTKPQFGLSKNQRGVNVRGVFAVRNPSPIKNKSILVVDDVCTTASTLEECAKTLKKTGAEKIFCLVVAHG